jgi:hypothetical protein
MKTWAKVSAPIELKLAVMSDRAPWLPGLTVDTTACAAIELYIRAALDVKVTTGVCLGA